MLHKQRRNEEDKMDNHSSIELQTENQIILNPQP